MVRIFDPCILQRFTFSCQYHQLAITGWGKAAISASRRWFHEGIATAHKFPSLSSRAVKRFCYLSGLCNLFPTCQIRGNASWNRLKTNNHFGHMPDISCQLPSVMMIVLLSKREFVNSGFPHKLGGLMHRIHVWWWRIKYACKGSSPNPGQSSKYLF